MASLSGCLTGVEERRAALVGPRWLVLVPRAQICGWACSWGMLHQDLLPTSSMFPLSSLLVKQQYRITVLSTKLLMCLDRMAQFGSPHLCVGSAQVIFHLNIHLMVWLRNVGTDLLSQIPSACFNNYLKKLRCSKFLREIWKWVF